MSYDIPFLVLAFLNLAVGLALLYFLLKNIRAIEELSNDKHNHLDPYFNDLLERIQRIEKNHPVQAIANIESRIPEESDSGADRIKSIVEKLREGGDPDEVQREHGFSRSEMGLILAAAGLTGN